jgi:hypothetical protein
MDDDVADQTEREYSGENVEQDYTGGTQASWNERGLSNEDFDNSISGQMDLREEGDDLADAILGLSNVEAKDSFIGNADLITSETNELERFSHMSESVKKAAVEVLEAQTQHLSGKALVVAKASYEAALGKSSDQFIKGLNVQATSPVTTLDPTSFSMKAVMKDGKIVYRAEQNRIKPYRDSFIAQSLSIGYDTEGKFDPIELDSGYSITGNVEQDIGENEKEELIEVFNQTKLINQPNIIGSFEPKASKQDVMVARSMLESVESYEARGPGSQVSGNYDSNIKVGVGGSIEGFYDDAFDKNSEEDKKLNRGSKDKRVKADLDFALAMANISDLAELYIDPRAKGGEMYGKQKAAVELALIKRFIDGQMSDEAKSILPLPNETGVTGLRVTRGSIGGQQGTPFTRLEFGLEANKRGWTPEGKYLKEGEENPYWRYLGTVGQSLFPKKFVKDEFGEEDVEANALNTRTRKYEEQVALDKARATRKILLEQMPTLRDETAGQSRTPGFDKPYGDQENIQHILDKVFGSGEDLKEFTGDNGSEIKEAIEAGNEAIERELNLPMKDFVGPSNLEGIEQRTPAWYKARENLITASKLTSTSGQLLDAEGMAAQLALEKYAKTDPELAKEIEFIGNSHVIDGQKGEKLALKEFLMMQKTEGDELTHTEVGLLQAEEMPGFGASPDGRLRDLEGNNRGLLELKYLTSGSMKGALKKYTPQMQLQMAVTGEKETNFFALDKYTGESIHEVVKADPDMQAEILEVGKQALEMSKTLTKEEAIEMKKQTKAQRRKSNLEERNETGKGQESSYEAKDYTDNEATSFNANEVNESKEKTFKRDKAKALNRDFESIAAMKEFDQSITEASEAAKKEAANNKAAARATKDRENADRDAAKATQKLRDAAIGAAKSLLGIVLSAKDSAMDTINLARRNGFDEDAVRGQEFAMVAEGGIPLNVAKSAIDNAGSTLRKLRTGSTAGAELRRMNTQYGSTPEILDTLGPMKSRNEIIAMGQDFLPFVQGEINKFPVGDTNRAIVAEVYGQNSQLAASTATMEEMLIPRAMNVKGNEESNQGYQSVKMYLQGKEENLVGEGGKAGGATTYTAEYARDRADLLVWIKENPVIAASAVVGGGLTLAAYNLAMGNSPAKPLPEGGAGEMLSNRAKLNSVDGPVYAPDHDISQVGAVTGSMANFNIGKSGVKLPENKNSGTGGEVSGVNSFWNSENNNSKLPSGLNSPQDGSIPLSDLVTPTALPNTNIIKDKQPISISTVNENNVDIQIFNDKDSTEVRATVGEDEYVNRENGNST